jgi:hypothetical protein
MTIDTVDKLIAQLRALQRDDIGALPPAERRRLIGALAEAHRIASIEQTVADAKAGVLADLKAGGRSQ